MSIKSNNTISTFQLITAENICIKLYHEAL